VTVCGNAVDHGFMEDLMTEVIAEMFLLAQVILLHFHSGKKRHFHALLCCVTG